MRGYQAQQGRELSRCLKELRLLRREPLAECTDEPETTSQNEPESPPTPANDDLLAQDFGAQNEPGEGVEIPRRPASGGQQPGVRPGATPTRRRPGPRPPRVAARGG